MSQEYYCRQNYACSDFVTPESMNFTSTGRMSFLCYFQSWPVLLRDGNSAFYPLAKSCTSSIRDPSWLDLTPLRCMSMCVQNIHNAPSVGKNKALVLAMVLEVSL